MKIYTTDRYRKKGKSVYIFRKKQTEAETTHTHEFIEILYVLSGSAQNVVDGQVYETKQGDLIFIHYGSTHAFYPRENYEYVNICFFPEVIGTSALTPQNALALMSLTSFDEMRCSAGGGMISFRGAERESVEWILRSMLEEREASQISWNTALESYLNILIIKMLRQSALPVPTEEADGMWRDLLAYIDTNLDSKLTLTGLAQKCFYNPSYFSRVFKEKFSVSPVEYINRKRVEYAIHLLRESKLSVDEIGVRVGFPDRSNFYHAFSKYADGAPADYRKNAKK